MTDGSGRYMAWPATTRYGLSVAPGTLGLVQDFLNTITEGTIAPPDLLATWPPPTTSRWHCCCSSATKANSKASYGA